MKFDCFDTIVLSIAGRNSKFFSCIEHYKALAKYFTNANDLKSAMLKKMRLHERISHSCF